MTQQSTTGTTGLIPLLTDDEALIPARQVPNYIGIKGQALARWRHEGRGPRFIKLGRLVFYRAGDLRTWVRRNVHDNTAMARMHGGLNANVSAFQGEAKSARGG